MVAVGLLLNVSSQRVKERHEETSENAPPPTETESLTRRFQSLGLDLAPVHRVRRKAQR